MSDIFPMTEHEKKQRRNRNLAIAGGIAAFIILIYTVTILRLGAAATGAGG